MKKYICYFNDQEYLESYDIVSKHVVTSENIEDCLLFDNLGAAYYIAEKFGCYYREIEVEET